MHFLWTVVREHAASPLRMSQLEAADMDCLMAHLPGPGFRGAMGGTQAQQELQDLISPAAAADVNDRPAEPQPAPSGALHGHLPPVELSTAGGDGHQQVVASADAVRAECEAALAAVTLEPAIAAAALEPLVNFMLGSQNSARRLMPDLDLDPAALAQQLSLSGSSATCGGGPTLAAMLGEAFMAQLLSCRADPCGAAADDELARIALGEEPRRENHDAAVVCPELMLLTSAERVQMLLAPTPIDAIEFWPQIESLVMHEISPGGDDLQAQKFGAVIGVRTPGGEQVAVSPPLDLATWDAGAAIWLNVLFRRLGTAMRADLTDQLAKPAEHLLLASLVATGQETFCVGCAVVGAAAVLSMPHAAARLFVWHAMKQHVASLLVLWCRCGGWRRGFDSRGWWTVKQGVGKAVHNSTGQRIGCWPRVRHSSWPNQLIKAIQINRWPTLQKLSG